MAEIPAGVWAIASHLEPAELQPWMNRAAAASAWTFRLPQASQVQSLDLLRQMRERTSWLAVHARSDWARLVGADAVIVGSRSLPAEVLARQIRPKFALGMPDHNPREAALAVKQAADFIICSPVWPTPSKHGILAPRGIMALTESCHLGLPVIALGGIETPIQVVQCRAAGAHAVMVLRAAKDPVLLGEMVAAWKAS